MKNLYSILDHAAIVFCPPFPATTDQEAIRLLEGAMQNPNTTVHKYPLEHSLYSVGLFNETTGELEYDDPKKIMSGFEVLARMKRRHNEQNELDLKDEK